MSRIKDSSQALKANRALSQTRQRIEKSAGRLASGKRITTAGDDAAGLSIATNMQSELRTKRAATRNANESIAIMHVMEGGIRTINELIIRVRELAVQSASDTVSNQERSYLHREATGLINEISRISEVNQHNSQSLMQGQDKRLDIQVGDDNNSASKLSFNLKDMAHTAYALGVYDVSLDTQHHANISMYKLDNALRETSKSLAKIGTFQSQIQHAISGLETSTLNVDNARSRIEDADVAKVASENINQKVKLQNQMAAHSTSQSRIAAYLKLLD